MRVAAGLPRFPVRGDTMRALVLTMCLAAVPSWASPACGAVTVAAVFGSGMVLQRDRPVPVWGRAEPGDRVEVRFGDFTATTTADTDGRWRTALPPMPGNATGREFTVTGPANRLRFDDVLVGEVWLGSGQSNMGLPLRSCANAAEEAAAADFPQIRFFTAEYAAGTEGGETVEPRPQAGKSRRFAVLPRENVNGSWKICTPKNAPNFSGTCYFFARRIHRELGVPVGMVVSSVGATAIEAWISIQALRKIPSYAERAESFDLLARACLADPAGLPAALEAQAARLGERQATWFKSLDAEDPGLSGGWMATGFDDGDWATVRLPVTPEDNPIGAPVASIWFRRRVTVPPEWSGQDLELGLGVLDAADEAFVNGMRVGRTWFDVDGYWRLSRTYRVPATAVTGTTVDVAMRLLKLQYPMAPLGPVAAMRLIPTGTAPVEPVPLAGEWRMKKAQNLDPGRQPRPASLWDAAPGGHSCQPGVMHNGMIHPLQPYAIRGALWYQGAANAPTYIDYRTLLPGLIRSWREEWGEGDFPFILVQQQDFWAQQTRPVERGGHTNIRQSQAMAVAVPKTMMVTAVGLGCANDSHPKNKQEVGRRLALMALAEVYGRTLLHDGPKFRAMAVEGDGVRLSFDDAQGLHARGEPPVGFAIAGRNRRFHFAKARIEGESVVVWSERVPEPVAVRYAWASHPVCNLYNAADLPMFPFATDSWDPSQLVIAEDEPVTIPTGWVEK